ncbi:hypothetical protein TBR22_A15360 [Luteitalea sp. TBR-22]|uniref:hypothetical protein n=1 Tax=Luteitalea sp. TBR-22 TaxID=2802971 RepID=UPI001AF122F1|nr:hypothetical protein [Luteitalea sp. TBR-22]BCS32326.1 hypothetical protein TBR22_A15360 [Luteitalea sp. TBR-22]
MRKMIPMMLVAAIATAGSVLVHAQASPQMSFFITSVGSGKGADLGGIRGADAHCQALAKAAGSTNKNWHAYLSVASEDGRPAVHAKDRIGKGPWYNAKGEMVAKDLADLHGEAPLWTKQTALNEKGQVVNGRGDTPNQHDILTGSNQNGTLVEGEAVRTTCSNWTASTDGAGSAMVGHFDRQGGGAAPTSLNAAHPSRGCSQANLVATGGAGLFYCFASK